MFNALMYDELTLWSEPLVASAASVTPCSSPEGVSDFVRYFVRYRSNAQYEVAGLISQFALHFRKFWMGTLLSRGSSRRGTNSNLLVFPRSQIYSGWLSATDLPMVTLTAASARLLAIAVREHVNGLKRQPLHVYNNVYFCFLGIRTEFFSPV